MTSSSSVITDAEAREIAQRLNPGPRTVLGLFVETGEIQGFLADLIRAGLMVGVNGRLAAYVAFHGERGPVDGWSEL